MDSFRCSSLLVYSLLASLSFQSVDNVDNYCTEEGITETGSVTLSATCTRSSITVYFVGSNFDYSRALYYECNSVNGSGSLPLRVEDIRRVVTGEVDLPYNTTCTVFGCYAEAGFGYNRLFNNGSCTTDINECELEPRVCDENATCTNTDGSYTCACDLGFSGNGTNCEDVDECSSDALNNCYEFENRECNNTFGSFDCICSSGYNTSDGENCTDIDECELKPCHEQATCTNPDGSHTCVCNSGFTGDGISCEDVDECEVQSLNTCHEFADCNNTIGSYNCSCKPGFQGNGLDCTDVDECSSDGKNDCHTFANTVCLNTDGGYECICKPGYSRNGVNCSETSGEGNRHIALGVGLTLPLVLVAAGGALTLVFVLWRCRRGRRSFRHYKFNVRSEVDLNYSPQGLQLDAFFSFQRSMGSILHELKYDSDTPITTDIGSEEGDFKKHPGKSTKAADVKEEDTNSGAQNIHDAANRNTRDDDNSSISTRVGDELLYSGISDCNSSRGMTSFLTRMHETQSNPSTTGGYISEQSGGLMSLEYCPWNGWQNGVNQAQLNTKGAKTDYLTENAISASQVRVSAPVGGSPSETTAGSTQATTQMGDRDPHTEAYGDTKHLVSSTVPTGYVSSDQLTLPSSGQSSTEAATANDPVGKRTHPLPTQPRAFDLPQPPTTNTAAIQPKDTQEPPPTTTATRAVSLASLNIITDLEQAFPRFASEDSLYRHYTPATALPQPSPCPRTSRARSEIHLNYVYTQAINHRVNNTVVSSQKGISFIDTPYVSGGRCPTPEHLAPDLIADTPADEFQGRSTNKATEHSNTHTVSFKSREHTGSRTSIIDTVQMPPELSVSSYPHYVNLDSSALTFTGESENSRSVSFEVPQEVGSAVAREECGHPLHSTASPTTTVTQGVTDLWKASYQQPTLPQSASDDSEREEPMPPQHVDISSSVTSSPAHSYKNSSESGFHNVLFDLPETLVESEIEDP